MNDNIQEIIDMYNFVLAGRFVLKNGKVDIEPKDKNLLNTEGIVYLWVANNVIAYVGETSLTFIQRNHKTPFNKEQPTPKYTTALTILEENTGHLDIYIRIPNKQTVLCVHDISLRHAEEMSIHKYLERLDQGHLECNRQQPS
jgi:hypothetical protein